MEALERWLIRESVRTQLAPIFGRERIRHDEDGGDGEPNGAEDDDDDHTVKTDKERNAAENGDGSTSKRSSKKGNGRFRRLFSRKQAIAQTPVLNLSDGSSPVVEHLLRRIADFPLFRNDERMRNAIQQILELLPRLDMALKKRNGATTLEKFLVSVVAGPILASARARRQAFSREKSSPDEVPESQSEANENNDSAGNLAEAAAMVLEEIVRAHAGVKILLEEIKAAHEISELRPSLQALFAMMRRNWTRKFVHAVRRKPAQTRKMFRRIPKQLVINALKLHASNAASTAVVHILFAKPFGGSLWQRFLAEALNVDVTGEELERIRSFLSEECQQILISQTEDFLIEFDEEEVERLYGVGDRAVEVDAPEKMKARRTVVLRYLEREHPKIYKELTEEPQKWAALRFVELIKKKEGLDVLIEVLGSDEFAKSLKTIMSSSKTKLADSLLAKGSGLVKLVEEVFSCIETGLRLADTEGEGGAAKSDDATLGARIGTMLEQVQYRLLTVLHNVLLNDPDLVIHESLCWFVDLYRNARALDIPTIEILCESLSDEARSSVVQEAEAVRQRDEYNLTRPLGAAKRPRPKLIHASRLIARYCDVIDKDLLLFQSPKYEKKDILFCPTLEMKTAQSDGTIGDVEVAWSESQWSALQDRGFVTCGENNSITVWCRSIGHRYSQSIYPIVAIAVDDQYKPDDGWIYIPRNLNKDAFGAPRIFLKYKRGSLSVHSSRLLGLYMLDDSDDRNDVLDMLGKWTIVGSFRNSLLSDTHLWALVG